MKVGVNNNNIAYWSEGYMTKDIVKSALRGARGSYRYSPYASDFTDASGWPTSFNPNNTDGSGTIRYLCVRQKDVYGENDPGRASSIYYSGVHNVYYEGPLSAIRVRYDSVDYADP